MCVKDASYCNKDNGCPFDRPQKCLDGACIGENEKCSDKNVT